MNDQQEKQPAPLDTIDRIDELLSMFFDDRLSQEEAAEFDQLLLADPRARTRLVDAALLDADLHAFFRGENSAEQPERVSS